MSQPNNPAGRLLELLSGRDLKQLASNKAAEVWAEIFGVPEEDPRFISLLIKALQLPWHIEKEIRAIPDVQHEIYLTWVPSVKQAFLTATPSGQFHAYVHVIDKNVRSLLTICDDQLSRRRPQPIYSGKCTHETS